MTTFVELIESRRHSIDANGNRQGVRVWFADTPDPIAARTLFVSDVPDFRTFPGDEAFRFSRIDTALAPNASGCRLEVSYSSRSPGNLLTPPRELPIVRDWEGRRIVADIPLNVRVSYTNEEPPGFTTDVWAKQVVQDAAIYPGRVFAVRVDDAPDAAFDTIATQQGRVHRIGGRWMQLVDASVERLNDAQRRVVYRYTIDTGTRAQTTPSGVLFVHPDNRPASGPDPATGVTIEDYWRLPFEVLSQLTSSDPEFEPHPCQSLRPVFDATGHLTMPGGALLGGE